MPQLAAFDNWSRRIATEYAVGQMIILGTRSRALGRRYSAAATIAKPCASPLTDPSIAAVLPDLAS